MSRQAQTKEPAPKGSTAAEEALDRHGATRDQAGKPRQARPRSPQQPGGRVAGGSSQYTESLTPLDLTVPEVRPPTMAYLSTTPPVVDLSGRDGILQ